MGYLNYTEMKRGYRTRYYFNWKLSKGEFVTRAEVTFDNGDETLVTDSVEFKVN